MILALPQTPTSPIFATLRKAALGLVATVALLGTSASALAGKEYDLLNLQLGNTNKAVNAITTANATTLVNAVNAVITANPSLKPGKIIGEALKFSTAPGIGGQLATDVVLASVALTAQKEAVAADAIKSAASGKGLSVANVPGFTAPLVDDDPAALSLAGLVKASKVAVGAVLQGRGSEEANDGARITLANTALDPVTGKTISAAAMEIAAGIARTVTNPVAFTNALVADADNVKNLLKIIPGIAAGQPTAAGAVVSAALTNATYAPQGSLSPIIKGAAALAKSVGAVADIEQIEKVGKAIAAEIPKTTLQKGKNVPNIKLGSAVAIVTTLAKAIAAKPYADLVGGTKTGDAFVPPGANAVLVKNSEKADELVELGAYFLAALSTSAEFIATKVSKGVTVAVVADKIVTGILKAVISGGKIAAGKSNAAPTKTDITSYTSLLAVYAAGSVALTVAGLPETTPEQIALKNSIKVALRKTGFAKSLAGSTNEQAIIAAIELGLSGNTLGRFENGFDVATGALTDPETNIRNF